MYLQSLAAVEVEMAEYEGRLNANNEKKLRQLMDIINQKISIKSFSDIYTAASDLDSYWSRLKKELDSKPVPTPEPSPSLPPKPTEKPKETQTPIPSDESAPSQEIEEPESTEMVISAEN